MGLPQKIKKKKKKKNQPRKITIDQCNLWGYYVIVGQKLLHKIMVYDWSHATMIHKYQAEKSFINVIHNNVQ